MVVIITTVVPILSSARSSNLITKASSFSLIALSFLVGWFWGFCLLLALVVFGFDFFNHILSSPLSYSCGRNADADRKETTAS